MHEIWRDRGASIGRALDDWLHAEKEIVWRPAVEVRRIDGAFVVEAAVVRSSPAIGTASVTTAVPFR